MCNTDILALSIFCVGIVLAFIIGYYLVEIILCSDEIKSKKELYFRLIPFSKWIATLISWFKSLK